LRRRPEGQLTHARDAAFGVDQALERRRSNAVFSFVDWPFGVQEARHVEWLCRGENWPRFMERIGLNLKKSPFERKIVHGSSAFLRLSDVLSLSLSAGAAER
jgi:hypothetical protein